MPTDPARRALADLRETCAAVLDARTDLPNLLAQHFQAVRLVRVEDNPVAESMERALPFVRDDLAPGRIEEPLETPEAWSSLLASGVEKFAPGACVLDPCAGGGSVLAAMRSSKLFGHEARLLPYYRTWARLKAVPGQEAGLSFANPLLLPEWGETPGFDFLFDENAERLRRGREAVVDAVVGDLRNAVPRPGKAATRAKATYGASKGTLLPMVRWMSDRLGRSRRGVVAFISDEEFVDEPSLGGFRAALEREFDLIAHVALEGAGITFLVRGTERKLLYANALADDFDAVAWRKLSPTENHVWRPEILRPEWTGFMPLAGRRAVFEGCDEGVKGGRDLEGPDDRRARPVLRRPFVRVWRRPERGAVWPDAPFLVVSQESFGAFVANAVPDRRCAGPVAVFAQRGVTFSGRTRFRTVYGPGVTSEDVFDYTVALLHHPLYRERYHEDLRRGLPRLPLLDLGAVAEMPDAPPVGPGSSFGTGWTAAGFFEPGTVPDYDDPFASPYARADVEPGFLLLSGLGAALGRLHTHYDRIVPYPLERIEKGEPHPFARLRLSRDRTRVLVHPGLTLAGVPPQTFDFRLGTKSGLEWVVEGFRPRGGFAPDAEAAARLVGQVVAASLEANRLVDVLSRIELKF